MLGPRQNVGKDSWRADESQKMLLALWFKSAREHFPRPEGLSESGIRKWATRWLATLEALVSELTTEAPGEPIL
jgi:hypothetical protein